MKIVFDILLIFFLFTLFGVSHTILASNKVKRLFIKKEGDKIAFYRLFYNLSSIVFFLTAYYLAPKPDILIYALTSPYNLIIFGLQALSLLGLIWSASFIDLKEFAGFTQIKRYFNNEYETEELDEHSELIIKGPFKFTRHPIYLFSILFLGLRPSMDLFYLTFFLCLTIYFVIGSFYEEKKLISKFGVTYIQYQKEVPRLLPFKFLK